MKPIWLLPLLVACSQSALPGVRFANQPAVRVVDDRRDVREPPARRTHLRILYHYDGTFHRRISRALDVPRPRRALGVNALDEVPDSTWFTNRIGVRALSLDELRDGPTEVGSPEPHVPWTVLRMKEGGTSLGFVIRDARGVTYLLKPDTPGYPELESAAHVIINRVLWAVGYNVPEDHVVYVHPRDLVVAPDAKLKDALGHEHPFDRAALDARLARHDRTADGKLRAVASRFVDGKVLGGHPGEGVRRDDPNDRIPHQLRRDLRGALPIFAWLDHVDVKESNTLDAWIEDRQVRGCHYVKHYLIDFGRGLGAMAMIMRDLRRGYAYNVDFPELTRSFTTLGLLPRPWERRRDPALRGIGMLDTETYDPGAWKPIWPSYAPFLVADDRDKFWGAKLLARFDRDAIRALVEAGRLTDPRAVEYLTEVLIRRQRATALHWFERAGALDGFAVDGDDLCFADLTIAYGLAPVTAQTHYVARFHDRRGTRIGDASILRPGPRGRTCVPVTLSSDPEGYTIVKVETHRRAHIGTVYVHLARDPATHASRVIGIWLE